MNTRIFATNLLIIPALLTGVMIKAQSVTVGAKTGVISSKFVGNSDIYSRNAFYLGAVANKRLSSIYSIQLEINYASKGSNSIGQQPIPYFISNKLKLPASRVYYASFKNETILNNVEIPVLAIVTLRINSRFKYYLLVGPHVSFLAHAKSATSGSSIIYQDPDGKIPAIFDGDKVDAISFNNVWNARNEFRKFNVGADGGIGFSYGHPCVLFRVFLEGRLSMNISNIHKPEFPDTHKSQNSKILVLGFLYKL